MSPGFEKAAAGDDFQMIIAGVLEQLTNFASTPRAVADRISSGWPPPSANPIAVIARPHDGGVRQIGRWGVSPRTVVWAKLRLARRSEDIRSERLQRAKKKKKLAVPGQTDAPHFPGGTMAGLLYRSEGSTSRRQSAQPDLVATSPLRAPARMHDADGTSFCGGIRARRTGPGARGGGGGGAFKAGAAVAGHPSCSRRQN